MKGSPLLFGGIRRVAYFAAQRCVALPPPAFSPDASLLPYLWRLSSGSVRRAGSISFRHPARHARKTPAAEGSTLSSLMARQTVGQIQSREPLSFTFALFLCRVGWAFCYGGGYFACHHRPECTPRHLLRSGPCAGVSVPHDLLLQLYNALRRDGHDLAGLSSPAWPYSSPISARASCRLPAPRRIYNV